MRQFLAWLIFFGGRNPQQSFRWRQVSCDRWSVHFSKQLTNPGQLTLVEPDGITVYKESSSSLLPPKRFNHAWNCLRLAWFVENRGQLKEYGRHVGNGKVQLSDSNFTGYIFLAGYRRVQTIHRCGQYAQKYRHILSMTIL